MMAHLWSTLSKWPDELWPRDWVSFIGFWITVYVGLTSRRIVMEVQRRARLPEILASLEAVANEMVILLAPDSSDVDRIRIAGKTEGLLNTLRPYMDKDARRSLKAMIAQASDCKKSRIAPGSLQTLYGEVNRLIEEVRDAVRRG